MTSYWEALGALVAAVAIGATPAMASPQASTTTGLVSGSASADGAIAAFKGIPFAAPPVGPLRWAAPQPPIPWQGVRDATQFAADCSQPPPATTATTHYKAIGEDCLYLNVWTPLLAKGAPPAAVFVWFYGGGFVGGGTSDPKFDGERLARRGVVVVTANYRTGVMGYLAHPLLTKANGFAANAALLDEVQTLRWVKANIAGFGGDPARVTIAGESSGGIIVNDLMATHLADGLYARAVMESAPPWGLTPPMRSKEEAEILGSWFMANRGARTLEQMRALPVEALLTLKPEETAALLPSPFQPAVDGALLPRTTGEIFKLGWQSPVPLLIGSNRDEAGGFSTPNLPLDAYKAFLASTFGPAAAERLLAAYPPAGPADTTWASIHVRSAQITDATLAAAQLHRQIAPNTWLYRFDRAPPGTLSNGRIGAHHGAEVAYVFGNLIDRPYTDADRRLSDQIMTYWVNFIKGGDPNGVGLPAWPTVAASGPPILMALGDGGAAPVQLTTADIATLKLSRRLIDPVIQP